LTADTRTWEASKQRGPVLLRVLLVNKSNEKDLKIWYRLTADGAGANVALPVSARKTYLLANSSKVIDTFIKIDPTLAHFFTDTSAIKVDLEVTVRNAQGGAQDGGHARRVHYAAQESIGVGTQSNEFDEDDTRDDDRAYAAYQERPMYTGYDAHGSA
jgi:hypothetical protein